MRLIIALILTLGNVLTWAQAPQTIFTKEFPQEHLEADFRLFRTALEKIHPALYRYTSRVQMDSIFAFAGKRINKSMRYQEFYKLLAGINSQVRCQHTAIAPGKRDMDNIAKHAKMFPYEIMWDFDSLKAYAFSDLTHEGGIKPATEILSINGHPVKAVYDTLIKYLFSDGYNITSKQVRMVPTDFQFWYYLFIERPEEFTMEFLDNGSPFKKTVSAISLDEYRQNVRRYIKSKAPEVRRLVKHYSPQWKLSPYRLEFGDNATAILTLNQFGPLDFIHKSFQTIKNKEIKNLIIDVRRNAADGTTRALPCFLI